AIGIDRFYGFSSAWMRYLATEIQLRQALHRFHMQVEASRLELAGKPPELDDIRRLLALCSGLLLGLDDTMRDETGVWSSELRDILREMETAARTHEQARRTGEIRLTVANGEQAADGWSVIVDGGTPEAHKGRTATLRNLPPGNHIVQVRG